LNTRTLPPLLRVLLALVLLLWLLRLKRGWTCGWQCC
jgi:hypothetical protein